MQIPREELTSILVQFNPWWQQKAMPDLPSWKRSAFTELLQWVAKPPASRAVMLTGPRQVGKTTLVLQVIEQLLAQGVAPANIIYTTFDHPVFKLAGVDAVLAAWRELEPKVDGPEYLFLDEAQCVRDFGTWVKHQVDFVKQRKIVFTGSATPLAHAEQESGVGRWHTIGVPPLSFYEYMQLRRIALPHMPTLTSLKELAAPPAALYHFSEAARLLIGHFHEYLVRGGFPQTALVDSVTQAQKLLREDIIDKVLKRDMTALFGVRRVLELEQMFIFLCMHDGGIQDLPTLSKSLGVSKPTVQNFIALLEAAHLLHRLPPYGHGKEVLRARYKLYLADPAIASAVLMKGKAVIEDLQTLGNVVESAVFIHLLRYQARLSFWRSNTGKEVDLIAEMGEKRIPFEVKYRSQITQTKDVQGLLSFCNGKHSGYVITKEPNDIGLLVDNVLRIPAALFCYFEGLTIDEQPW